MTPSSSLDKAVLELVTIGVSLFRDVHFALRDFPERRSFRDTEEAFRRLRRQGAIRFDRRKGWRVT